MNDLAKNAINKAIEGFSEKKDCILSQGSMKELPSLDNVVAIIKMVREAIFPRYFAHGSSEGVFSAERELAEIYDLLYSEIKLAFNYDCEICCKKNDEECISQKSDEITRYFIESLPEVFAVLCTDIKATLAGDPAALSYDMILLTYPGIKAIFVYRLAHLLYEKDVPLIPRMMTEYAHSRTGIDINPGAKIGKYFFIDHGTGIVIGETTEIGEHVSIYQGVTLGAISLKDSRGLVGKKRHPTIKDNVTIYAGATILGGETVIGEGAVIGSSVFITASVDKYVTVTMEKPKLRLRKKE